MGMYDMTDAHYQTVYNLSSFTLASMMATTIFLWMRVPSIHEKYKTALLISGMVTFIAAYHYIRIFNSWTEAYEYKPGVEDPVQTGTPFNDAYRYMYWLLTVPLLLMEIVLVMKVPEEEQAQKCLYLGVSSGLMIIIDYPGELLTKPEELSGRWMYWGGAMIPFAYVVHTLLIGLKEATESEQDENVKQLIRNAQVWTVVSWLTYPFVYIIPMMGATGAGAVVSIQVGYCVSDIISKCGVGLIIYTVTAAKSELAGGGAMLPK